MTIKELKYSFDKCSVGPAGEVLAGYPGGMALGLTPVTAPIPTIAYLAGLAGDADNSQKSIGPAFIPGVSSYRMGNRIKTQVIRELDQIKKNEKHKGARPVAHSVAEHLGGGTSALATILAGAGIGGLLGGKKGALNGGAIGSVAVGAGTIIGTLAAAIKRRRTAEEQIESDKGSLVAKYLLPGKSVYDFYKRIGRSQGERDEAEAKKSEEKKASDLTVEKQAFSLAEVKNMLSSANNWYKSQSPEMRALIGAGVGLGGGALLGGSRKSALLGALAGAGTGAYWNDVRRAIDSVTPVVRDASNKTREYLKSLLGINKPDDVGQSAQASPSATATARANVAADS